jgi:hypothetical protein
MAKKDKKKSMKKRPAKKKVPVVIDDTCGDCRFCIEVGDPPAKGVGGCSRNSPRGEPGKLVVGWPLVKLSRPKCGDHVKG